MEGVVRDIEARYWRETRGVWNSEGGEELYKPDAMMTCCLFSYSYMAEVHKVTSKGLYVEQGEAHTETLISYILKASHLEIV